MTPPRTKVMFYGFECLVCGTRKGQSVLAVRSGKRHLAVTLSGREKMFRECPGCGHTFPSWRLGTVDVREVEAMLVWGDKEEGVA